MTPTPQLCSLCARPEADHDDAACSFGWTPPLPPLRVWTARVSYRGADRLDITRKSGTAGLFLAPSWGILRPALDARGRAFTIRNSTGGNLSLADRIEAEAWARYVPAYTAEMRVSYGISPARMDDLEREAVARGVCSHFDAWRELLAARERTLVCYCTDAARCHRRLAAALIVKCDAVDCGER